MSATTMPPLTLSCAAPTMPESIAGAVVIPPTNVVLCVLSKVALKSPPNPPDINALPAPVNSATSAAAGVIKLTPFNSSKLSYFATSVST